MPVADMRQNIRLKYQFLDLLTAKSWYNNSYGHVTRRHSRPNGDHTAKRRAVDDQENRSDAAAGCEHACRKRAKRFRIGTRRRREYRRLTIIFIFIIFDYAA